MIDVLSRITEKTRWMFRPIMGLAIIFVTQGIVAETRRPAIDLIDAS